MVLPGYALMSQGIDVHAAVWPGGTFARQEVLSRAFAMQGACYVVMAGGLMREQDMPQEIRERIMELDGRERQLLMPCDGASGIIGPDGEMLAGPLLNEEGILTAKMNPGRVMMQKMIADHAGHYSRPDVFEFRVNARQKRTVTFDGREPAAAFAPVAHAVDDGSIRSGHELAGAMGEASREFASIAEGGA